MSFSPLPETLSTDLIAVGNRFILDLGSGDGRLTERLRVSADAVLGLDLGRSLGRCPDIVADAVSPPFKPRSVGICVAANFLRQLPNPRSMLETWQALVADDGLLWILEDEPSSDGEPGELYRDLQLFLSKVAPERRGPLMSLETFRTTVNNLPGWTFGSQVNGEQLLDSQSLVNWLEAAGAEGSAEAAMLARRLGDEGLSYGRYWWARWSRGEAS